MNTDNAREAKRIATGWPAGAAVRGLSGPAHLTGGHTSARLGAAPCAGAVELALLGATLAVVRADFPDGSTAAHVLAYCNSSTRIRTDAGTALVVARARLARRLALLELRAHAVVTAESAAAITTVRADFATSTTDVDRQAAAGSIQCAAAPGTARCVTAA